MEKNLLCLLLLLPLFVTACAGKFSESESFLGFIRDIDPQNALNLDMSKLVFSLHPCFLEDELINGIIRCNKDGSNIIEIRFQNMNLSGKINADSLCRLQNLQSVNLVNNQIKGTIPDSVVQCTRLVDLNLSSNHLSGKVPSKALRKLRYLRKLDISNNDFSEYYYYSSSSKSEGSKLISRKLIQDPPESSPPANSDESRSSNKIWYTDWKRLAPLLAGVLLLLLGVHFMLKKAPRVNKELEKAKIPEDSPAKEPKQDSREDHDDVKLMTKKEMKRDSSELVFFVEESERFTLEELLQATADLRSESFGSSLYKVTVKNNMHYAVKRLKNLQVSSHAFGEILMKVSNLKHPNILPLAGYRSTGEEKLLIYKYQSNGSLLFLLNEYMQGKKEFPWKLRLSIAAGIARGLGFIYKKMEGKEEDIITHGNLKLSNILLNDHNEPLISEHGLSKFIDPNRLFFFASHGYTAPENSLTEKSDVYSFGVVLLELLTGKSVELQSIDLPRWVQSMVREEWTGEVFDKGLRETEYPWAFPMLNIALLCVARVPRNRPAMGEVLEKIEKVMEEYEQHVQIMQDEHHQHHGSTTCCSNNGSHEACCSLHNIIPETWDSPGSNY